MLAFLPAAWGSFVADDYFLLHGAERVEHPLWPFSRTDHGETEVGEFYRPVWVAWNGLIHALFGDEPGAFHAVNLLLFALVAVEVWLLARRILGVFAGWVAGFAFAVYPRHGESVAWIAGSTDLTATALGLAAILCLLAPWRFGLRIGGAAALAAGAATAKEIGFVVPVLAVLVVLWLPGGRRRWLGPLAIAGAQALTLVPRTIVLDGLGGYSEYPWTPVRAVGAAGTYLLAAVSPPQLELLRYPVLLAVPAVLLVLAAWALTRSWPDAARRRGALLGLAWFAVALVPVLNLPLDLNTTAGERLLFLPSVGLALFFAAVAPRRPLVLAAAGAAALALCLDAARNWVVAGRVADRVVAATVDAAPPGGQVIFLSVPANYETAHVTTGGHLDYALEHAGRPDVSSAFCITVQVRDVRPGQVRFVRRADGRYAGTTTWAAPFDFPILRDPSPLALACSYAHEGGDDWPPGLELDGIAAPAPTRQPAVLVYFDGGDLRACC